MGSHLLETLPAPLGAPLVEKVLRHLGLPQEPPTVDGLARLVDAYVQRVPWESVSRIVRRVQQKDTAQCPRWPETFWEDALREGFGGTCYESNLALAALLRALGYTGYLTINDMDTLIGCHSALVISLGNARFLVDVGLPVHAPLHLDEAAPTAVETAFHTYTATPDGPHRFQITRDRHPKSYCFTLNDRPVGETQYRAITTADYHPTDGQFLDRVIVVRVIGGRVWRFNSAEGPPYHLETFVEGGKTYHFLGTSIAESSQKVAARFGIPAAWVDFAMRQVV